MSLLSVSSQTIVRCLLVGAAVIPLSGCLNYIVLLGYLIGGPPSIEPDFDVATAKSMLEKDVKVAVVCYAPTEIKWNNEKVDQELGRYVSYRLHEKNIQVINPDNVQIWLDENSDWDTPDQVGAAFDVTYVIYIDLHQYGLFERNSSDLYRGRAEALVSVYEMSGEEGEKIYSKEIISKYPLKVARSVSEVPYDTFRRQYLSRLSDEIGRLFYEHYSGEDISHAT